MKPYSILIICSFLFFQSYAQVDSSDYTRYYHENGKVSSEGFLKKGVPEGYWRSYHMNGKLKTEGNRKNHKLDGEWKFYDEEENLVLSIDYKEGQKEGQRKTYNNGKLVKREHFFQDKKEGLTIHYYENGKIQSETPFQEGKESGLGYEYNENGVINTILTYKSGVLTKRQRINRSDDQGRKQNVWMEFYRDKRVKVEGTYMDDLKHGYWKYYSETGNLIRTERWYMGVLQEEDEDVAKVQVKREIDPNTGHISKIGSYVQGVKEGIHREYDAEGNVIAGVLYSRGIKLAEGITDDQGRRQGPWKFFYLTGELKEEGSYIDGLKTGEWTYYFLDGEIEQVGRYNRDRPVQTWEWFYPNGQLLRREEYISGKKDGLSEEYDESGNIIAKGKYVEDYRDGEWFYEVGWIREKGSYFDGEKNGQWVHEYTSNGNTRFKGEFINGVEEGRHQWYYESGQLEIRGLYRGGIREGVWEYYNPDGIKYLTIEYDNGEEVRYNGNKITYGRRYDKRLEDPEQ